MPVFVPAVLPVAQANCHADHLESAKFDIEKIPNDIDEKVWFYQQITFKKSDATKHCENFNVPLATFITVDSDKTFTNRPSEPPKLKVKFAPVKMTTTDGQFAGGFNVNFQASIRELVTMHGGVWLNNTNVTDFAAAYLASKSKINRGSYNGSNRIEMKFDGIGGQVYVANIVGDAIPKIERGSKQDAGKKLYDANEIGVVLETGGDGRRVTEYRIAKGDSLKIRYNFKWNEKVNANPPQIGVSKVRFNAGSDSSARTLEGVYASIGFRGIQAKCSDGECQSSVFDSGRVSALPRSGVFEIPYDTLVKKGLIDEKAVDANGQIAAKGFTIFPVLELEDAPLSGSSDLPVTSSSATDFDVKVYANKEAVTESTKKEGLQCDPTNTQECNSTEAKEVTGTSQPEGMSSVGELIVSVIGGLLNLVNKIIFKVFSWIVLPLLVALLKIQTFSDSFVNITLPGWVIIRDLMNILFVLAMLFLGVTTIFRAGAPNFRETLISIIVAALLVNFSLVVGQSILGIADTLQNQFLPADSKSIENLAVTLMVKPGEQMSNNFETLNGHSTISVLISFIFYTAVNLMTFAIFVALTAFLAVRVVALLVLLMFSPAAFGMTVMPQTKSYASQWWRQFMRYAFFTPVIAFFINMGAIMSEFDFFAFIGAGFGDLNQDGGFVREIVLSLGSHAFMLIFLVAGMKIASEMGIAGSGAITSFAKNFYEKPKSWAVKGAKGLAKSGGERLLEGASNTAGIELDPRRWMAGYKKYLEDEKQKRFKNRIQKGGVFGINAGSLAANPTDSQIFQAYDPLKWKNSKRMLKYAFTGGKGSKYYKEQLDKEQKFKGLMSEEELTKTTNRLTKLTEQNKLLVANNDASIGVERANSIKSKIELDLNTLNKDYQAKLDEEQRLISIGKPAEATVAFKEADLLKKTIDDLVQMKTDIDTAIASPISTAMGDVVNIGKIIDKLSDKDAKIKVKAVFDFQTFKDTVRTEMDEAKKKVAEDYLGFQELKKEGITSSTLNDVDKGIVNGRYVNDDSKKKAYQDLAGKARSMSLPENIGRRQIINQAVAEAKKKIDHIEDADDLILVYEDALKERDATMAMAVFERLAQSLNHNEITNKFGGGTGFDATQNFMKKMKEDFQMDDKVVFDFASDMSYLLESKGAYDSARLVQTNPDGSRSWMSEKMHNDIIANEMKKAKGPREIAGLPRFAFLRTDGNGSPIAFAPGGMEALRSLNGSNSNVVNQFTQGFRAQSAQEFKKVPNWEQELKNFGVHKNIIQVIKDTGDNVSDIYSV